MSKHYPDFDGTIILSVQMEFFGDTIRKFTGGINTCFHFYNSFSSLCDFFMDIIDEMAPGI